MKNLILFIGILIALLTISPKTLLFAAGDCVTISGGGTSCTASSLLQIQKTIQNPQNNEFVTTLDRQAPFATNQPLTFKIMVKNISNSKLTKITVKDTLPLYIKFLSGPGTYQPENRTIIYTIDSLGKGEAKTYEVKAQTGTQEQLTNAPDTVCLTNQVQATVNNRTGQTNAFFCIQKGTQATQPAGTPVMTKGGKLIYTTPTNTKTPAAGAEALALLALIPASGLGLYLRKKSHR